MIRLCFVIILLFRKKRTLKKNNRGKHAYSHHFFFELLLARNELYKSYVITLASRFLRVFFFKSI